MLTSRRTAAGEPTVRIVADASVVLAALLPERHTVEARHALSEAERIHAPDLLLYEIVSALHSRVKRGDLLPEQADLKRLEARALPAEYAAACELDAAALALADRLGHSAYDCFYLALAIERECALVTADRALARAAHSAGLDRYVHLLGDELLTLRPARPEESALLSDLACAAKAHWDYPPDLMAIWADDLGVSPGFIERHHVICAERGDDVVGFAAVCEEGGAFELEHLWIRPDCMRQGVGRALLGEIVGHVRPLGATELRIVSDPHAERFYLKLGARRIGEKESTKRPGRFLPILVLDIEPE